MANPGQSSQSSKGSDDWVHVEGFKRREGPDIRFWPEDRASEVPDENIKPYAPPLLDPDYRDYVSGKSSRPAGLLNLMRPLQTMLTKREPDYAPYGRDTAGQALHGPVGYEEHNPNWTGIDLKRKWDDDLSFLRNRFNFIKEIGTGAFAVVWEVVDTTNNQRFACKVTEMRRYKRSRTLPAAIGDMLNEANVLRELNHNNILAFDVVVYEQDSNTGFPTLFAFFFMQLCDGSLRDQLRAQPQGRMDERQAHYWFVQIAGGLDYLHSQNVSHLDIKPANILFQTSGTDFVYKLADFGLSKIFSPGERNHMTERWGTPSYMAPELFDFNQHRFPTRPLDIYALGVSLGGTLCGVTKPHDVYAWPWIMRNIEPLGYPNDLIVLIMKMTEDRARMRFTIQQVMNYDWVKNGP